MRVIQATVFLELSDGESSTFMYALGDGSLGHERKVAQDAAQRAWRGDSCAWEAHPTPTDHGTHRNWYVSSISDSDDDIYWAHTADVRIEIVEPIVIA